MTHSMKTKVISMLFVFIMVFCTVFWAVQSPVIARAESTTYSDALDDLKKDSSFKESNYPLNSSDNSLQIIQLAESVNKELFVYVYQPSGQAKNLKASSINISTTINDDISFYNYKLEYLNSSGVFYKYKVKDFTVRPDAVRYYVITSIYRPWDSTLDKGTGNDNTITEVEYNISRQYAFGEINGNPYVNCVDIETIVVTDKFVGFVRYENGFAFFPSSCDSHFVAFNTDRPIDKLLEADVYYTAQDYGKTTITFVGPEETFGEKADNYAYLKYTDKVEHTGNGLFAGTYKWDRIQTVEDFIAGEDTENVYHGAIIDVTVATKLTDSALNELKGKKWVLRFAETTYMLSSNPGATSVSSTIVGDVTILRLKFETDGITYNLGVIDNKQSGGSEPSNETEVEVELNSRGKTILYLIMLILLFVLLAPILPQIMNGIVWIISLPFKAISKANEAHKKRKKEDKESNEKSVSDK